MLAGEMNGRGDASPSESPDAAPSPESVVTVQEAATPRHAGKTVSASNAASKDAESKDSPEEGSSDPLAGILAGLGVAHPPAAAHVPVSIPADARIANVRTGGRDSGRSDADANGADSASASSSRESAARSDIFPWSGSYGAGGSGTGTPGAVDASAAKTYSTAAGENSAAGIQAAQGMQDGMQDRKTAQAVGRQGKQDILLNLDGNAAKPGGMADRMERAGRDAGKLDDMQRNDFKFGALNLGAANESERKTVMDPGSQAPLSSSTPPLQAGFMAQSIDSGFTMADTGAAAPASTMQDLQAPVGASGWDEALGQRVLLMVSGQEQVAELSLNPPDLGPLQVTLSISNDQATATFVSQHAEVRQALEAALPRLKEMMAESGINLGGASVSSGGEGSQQQGFERPGRPDSRYSSGATLAGQANDNGMAASSPGRKSMLVDIFA
jgi:flagellar hook-length control protein FliK